jgi:hypothetical protein
VALPGFAASHAAFQKAYPNPPTIQPRRVVWFADL